MEKRVKAFLKDNNININKPIVVAVSGGADSIALLNILYNLKYNVIMAHVNHHMREQSEIEEKAMIDLAKKLKNTNQFATSKLNLYSFLDLLKKRG